MDECLPTVSLSTDQTGAVNAPDHGDLWRNGWRILEQDDSSVVLTTECFSLPLSFTRKLSVHASQLRVEYNIRNLAQTPVPFLYACHPLYAVNPGDRVILPNEVRCLYLHYSLGDRIGNAGERVAWPLAGKRDQKISLDKVGNRSDGTAEMLYTTNLTHGICALYRSQRHQALVVRFNTRALPYLGLWFCNGGWPDNPDMERQYAVALEPTVAPYGSLVAAVAARSAPLLKPRGHFNFSICMEVLGCDRPWSYDEVAGYIANSS
jgi:galactose mutarotase-like enzyme